MPLSVRLSFFYFALFAYVGVWQPFWPVWLAARGLGPTEISVVLAAPLWVKVVANPLVAQAADRLGERKRLMVALIAGACGLFALFAVTSGFWPVLILTSAMALFWSPLMPLGENVALLSARRAAEVGRAPPDYGRVRLWGSLSYILAALLAGALLSARGDAPGSESLVFALMLAAMTLTLLACFGLPDPRTDPADSDTPKIRPLLRQRRFVLFLCGHGAIQASHSVYYGFATLHWRAAGLSDDAIGFLWALAVVAEVALFAVAGRLFARLSPGTILALAGGVGALRWALTATDPGLAGLVVIQCGHAFTFGAAHFAAMRFIDAEVPAALSASAQSLYSAIAMGVSFGVVLPLAGALYAALGALAYAPMAGLALLAVAAGLGLARPRPAV